MNNPAFQDHDFGITTIDTGYIRPYLAASHLLVEGDRAAFVDVGTTFSIPRLLAVLHAKEIPLENVDYVIVTHVHLDHAGGSGSLMQALPNARLVAHPRGASHLIDPTRLIAGTTDIYGEARFRRDYGEIVPIPAARVISAGDQHTLSLNGRPLLFLDTPGHAKHHFCVFDERSQSFFTGDTFGISYREFDTDRGSFIFAPTTPTQFQPSEWHTSIERLLSYKPQHIYLTHYGQVSHIPVLANRLHECIDKLALLMEEISDADVQRSEILAENIMTYFLQEIRALGCQLTPQACRELLQMDVELNAQGLEIWWDRE